MIADMGANVKGRAVIRSLQRGEHFKKIIQRAGRAGGGQPAAFRAGKFGEHLGHVIRHRPVIQARFAQDMADRT